VCVLSIAVLGTVWIIKESMRLYSPSALDTASTKPKPPHLGNTEIEPNTLPEPNFNSTQWLLTSPDYPKCDKPMKKEDITYSLITQGSEDRLWKMRHYCERWKGNISYAVYTYRTKDDILESILESTNCHREQLTITVVPPFKELVGYRYPHNYMRRMALEAAPTSHVLYLDMDFVPSTDLEATLYGSSVLEQFVRDSRTALVIPAFEMDTPKECLLESKEETDKCLQNINDIPKTKKELLEDPKNLPFHMFKLDSDLNDLRLNFPGGHAATDFAQWLIRETGDVYRLRCIHQKHFEPYVVVAKCRHLPPPQDQIFDRNKISWLSSLKLTGYIFKAVAGSYCLHLPHTKGNGLSIEKSEIKDWAKRKEYEMFIDYLQYHPKYDSDRMDDCSDMQTMGLVKGYIHFLNAYYGNSTNLALDPRARI